MSDDLPYTPEPFPLGLVSFGFAFLAMVVVFSVSFGGPGMWEFVRAGAWLYFLFLCGWLSTGVVGLGRNQWKGFALGCLPMLSPLVPIVIILGSWFS